MTVGKKSDIANDSRNILYQEAENKSNRANLRCLIVLAIVVLVCEILNEIGVFQIAPIVMHIGAALAIILFLLPVFILAYPLRLFGKDVSQATYCKWHKYLILIFAWLGTAAACVMLTHHTVIAMAVPILLMAQYRDTRRLVPITIVFATICTFLGVYGGYFFGCFDGNLLHMEITDDNAFDLALRKDMASWKRMYELFTHYVLARELIVLSLIFLATKISKRNDEMLQRQAELQESIEAEMQRTNSIQQQIIIGMANLIENRDENTGEHVKRTSFYVDRIAHHLQADPNQLHKLSDEEVETIVRAAPLHDIGKIVVADRILQKPGKLTSDEFDEIKLHASEGARVIENVLGNVEDDAFLESAKDISGCHHERWDGTGYPKGLKGEEIPLSARIMAVADVFDALVSERVYKSAVDPERAYEIIISESGKQFDPDVVEAFCRLKPEIMKYLSPSKCDSTQQK